MEKFIGKEVKFTVAFGSSLVNTGSISKEFLGTLESFENEYLYFSNIKEKVYGFTNFTLKDYSNHAVINKQYLVLLAEI